MHRKTIAPLLIITLLVAGLVSAQIQEPEPLQKLKFSDFATARDKVTRGNEPTEKLSPELRILVQQYASTRGGDDDQIRFSDQQLKTLFGIDPEQDTPSIGLSIELAPGTDSASLEKLGAQIYLRFANHVLARAPITSVERLARESSVNSMEVQKAASIPPIPEEKTLPKLDLEATSRGAETELASASITPAVTKGLTGKGVIIGVVDTGIDWKHPDFIRADGTSRVLAIWDMTDDSWKDSAGKIGGAPPTFNNRQTFGTIYTNQQINAALGGKGRVNTMDYQGHGTASAGTAAGNGRAGIKALQKVSHRGVAPEADLIIVKASDCGSFPDVYILGTLWITQLAQSQKRPVVINHSLGGHFSAHDGSELEERVMNELVGPGKPGIAITVAAGNEGTYNLHAGGRFGPKRSGQADAEGPEIFLSVNPESLGKAQETTKVLAFFDHRDDWGLYIQALRGSALVTQDARPLGFFIAKVDNQLKYGVPEGMKPSASFWKLLEQMAEQTKFEEKLDRVVIPLPPGRYILQGFGATAKVVNGTFNLYLPAYWEGDFGQGTLKQAMVGSPGNAQSVITVGSYDFRNQWLNQTGQAVIYNLRLGEVSDYSNPGGPQAAGSYKPDITAPARFTVSSLSQGTTGNRCQGGSMGAGSGNRNVTGGGFYVAWSGTSAAAPFTAGVIALMLQKNPSLDSEQIKQILRRTAIRDDNQVGAVPNPDWGYGKINAAAAIAATPVASAAPAPKRAPGRTR